MELHRKRVELIVGIFVVLALLICLGYVFIKLSDIGLFEERVRLTATFAHVHALQTGATVLLEGIEIGNVKKVEFDQTNRIQLTLSIRKRFLPQIRADSVAVITQLSLLGDPVVNISVGSPDTPAIEPGAQLNTTVSRLLQPQELQNMIADIADLVRKLNTPEHSFGHMIEDKGKIYNELTQALESGNRIFAQGPAVPIALAKGSVATIDVTSELQKQLDQLSQVMAKLEILVDAINTGEGTFGTLVKDKKLYNETLGLVQEARDVFKDLKVVAHDLRQTTPRLPALVESGEMLINRANTLVQQLQANPLMGGGTPPKPSTEPAQIHERLRTRPSAKTETQEQ